MSYRGNKTMTDTSFKKNHLLSTQNETEPSLVSRGKIQIPDLTLVGETNPRFRLIRAKKGIVRVDIQKAREAFRQTMRKHAQFFET